MRDVSETEFVNGILNVHAKWPCEASRTNERGRDKSDNDKNGEKAKRG